MPCVVLPGEQEPDRAVHCTQASRRDHEHAALTLTATAGKIRRHSPAEAGEREGERAPTQIGPTGAQVKHIRSTEGAGSAETTCSATLLHVIRDCGRAP